jgi:putative glutamine amidotransferase
MPVLGICRGQQLINVALGGSLVIDIPTDLTNPVIHQIEEGDATHRLFLEDGSYLKDIADVDSALVNSNHHQAVDKLSRELKPSGYTRDGIIESYEWRDVSFKSWMLAVQWHPERLERDHPLSEPLASEFIEAAEKYKKKLKKK